MDLDSVFASASDAWTKDQINRVSEWLCRPEQLHRLVRIVYGFTAGLGRRDLDLAEDIVAQVLANLWRRSYATYDPARSRGSRAPFWRWVCVAARNRTVSHIAQERRRKEWERRAFAQAEAEKEDCNSADDSDGSEAAFLRDRLPAALALLPAIYREAIEFRMKGLSHQQAAEQSQSPCAETAMRARLVRARRELRRLMEAQMGNQPA